MTNNDVTSTNKIMQLAERVDVLEKEVKNLNERLNKNKFTILLMSGDLDKALVAFIVAAGAITMGYQVTVYCTYWGLNLLKRKTIFKDTTILEKMAKVMMPKGPDQASLSRMHMFGMGTKFFKVLMKKNHVVTLADLIETTRMLGVKLYACEMTMGIMGMSRDELIENIEYGGVETYLKEVVGSEINFIV